MRLKIVHNRKAAGALRKNGRVQVTFAVSLTVPGAPPASAKRTIELALGR